MNQSVTRTEDLSLKVSIFLSRSEVLARYPHTRVSRNVRNMFARIDTYSGHMAAPNPQREYLTQRVAAASPMDLIRMLYEGAVQAVTEALEALHSGDILRRGQSVTKAIEIITELRVSLRHEVHPAYCETLGGLYSYLQRQLIRAHAEKSEGLFQEAARLLQTLLDGWTGAMENLNAGGGQMRQPESDGRATRVSSSAPYSGEPEETKTPSRSWQF